MKVIYNRLIPFKGYKCVNLFGVLFVREGCTMTDTDYNHEAIHTAQMKELLYVPFYVLYVLEWLLLWAKYHGAHTAYLHISYEVEANLFQSDANYLKNRPKYNEYKLR